MTKGRKIDLITADEAEILDTFDLMATLGCSRDTLRVHMRKGIIPPALDRAGCRYRWTAGYLRDWNRMRTQQALEQLSKKKPSATLPSATRGSEFDRT